MTTSVPVIAGWLPTKFARHFGTSVELMQDLARACGHDTLSDLTVRDKTGWKCKVTVLGGIRYAGTRVSRPTWNNDG